MTTVNINGVDLELDLLDADVLERYEGLNEKIVKDIKEPKQYEGLSAPDSMRLQCRIVDGFFDDLFGAGTAQKCFNGSNNIGVRMEAFAKVSKMSALAHKEFDSIIGRYKDSSDKNPEPRENRKQRRAKRRSFPAKY